MYQTYSEFEAEQARLATPKGDPLTMPVAQARALRNAYYLSLVRGRPEVASSTDVETMGPVGPFKLRVLIPLELKGEEVILFVRGSGYWAGSLETHDETARSLANLTGLRVCAVDYHPAPESKAPVQLQELALALEMLAEGRITGSRPDSVLLYAESAGAHLCLSLTVQLRDAEADQPAGMVLFYPGAFGPGRHRTRASYQWIWASYLGSEDGAASPYVPMNHDLRGVCPAWVGVGDADPLLQDSVDLVARLREVDVPAELRVYPDLPHGFVGFSSQVRPAYEALKDSARALGGFVEQARSARRTPTTASGRGLPPVM